LRRAAAGAITSAMSASAPPYPVVIGQAPREAAAIVLSDVLDNRVALDEALARQRAFDRLAGEDRSFARAIVSAALRRLGALDNVLAAFMARPLPAKAGLARAVLRCAAAELLVLGAPAHAAVHTAVSVLQAAPGGRSYAGLANAVLRRIAQEGAGMFGAAPPEADAPDWVVARWRAAYGAAKARAILTAARTQPPLDLTAPADAWTWLAKLGAVRVGPTTARLVQGAPEVARLPGYDDGAWWVQDVAASLPAHLLAVRPGERVADLCAAPGGKTLQLAAAGASVVAVDRSHPRLERLRVNLARCRLTADVVCADLMQWTPQELFDAVLLDAPCSATGTLRRHPEVLWIKDARDIARLAALQRRLLERALAWLKPGGRLLYCVCSLEPEEGEGVVGSVLDQGLARRQAITQDEAAGFHPTAAGDLRTFPDDLQDIGGADGFFMARLVIP
jgi:16S rRNA (cytosine967-C5)-methyltransferase